MPNPKYQIHRDHASEGGLDDATAAEDPAGEVAVPSDADCNCCCCCCCCCCNRRVARSFRAARSCARSSRPTVRRKGRAPPEVVVVDKKRRRPAVVATTRPTRGGLVEVEEEPHLVRSMLDPAARDVLRHASSVDIMIALLGKLVCKSRAHWTRLVDWRTRKLVSCSTE